MEEGRGKGGSTMFGHHHHHLHLPLLVLALVLGLFGPVGLAGAANAHERDRRSRRIERVIAEMAAGGAPAPGPASPSSSSHVYHVTDYGADPTGSFDSTAAITRAVSDAFSVSSDHILMPGIKDLGGPEIHLDGGAYLISSPITLPSSGGGNFKIHSGSLRASDDFPTDRYLIELWSSAASSSQSARVANASELLSTSGYEYEYITLRDLMLDSNYRGGGIAVVSSLRTTIDNCYIVRFNSDGIWVKGGHETMIRGSYIGQHITAGGNPGERNFTGTGINLNGNDNAITDTVIFSAATGVLISGQANTLSGVHCYNKATGFGGTGIYLKLPNLTQTRIVNCYLDFTGIVSEDPVQLIVSNSFFLGDATVVFKAVRGVIKYVSIVDNLFSGGGQGTDIVQLDESNLAFTNVDGVVVERNGVNGMALRSTVAKGMVKGNDTSWTVDFSSVLLFRDRIDHVLYSLQADSGFPNHALRNVSGNRVVIESDVAVQATVHVAVDQMGGTVMG